MPIDRTYFEEQALIVTTATGLVTNEDFLENSNLQMAVLAESSHYRFILADWSQVEKIDTSVAAIQTSARQLASAIKINPRNGFFAIVAFADITYGLARMWQAWAEEIDWEIQLFRTREEAEHWLNEKMDR